VSAQVFQLPRRPGHDPELTYPQLAALLGVSKRFLQARHAEGMPSCGFDYAGRRLFRLSEVTAWLDARQNGWAVPSLAHVHPFRRRKSYEHHPPRPQ
jgi:hypothetical protein